MSELERKHMPPDKAKDYDNYLKREQTEESNFRELISVSPQHMIENAPDKHRVWSESEVWLQIAMLPLSSLHKLLLACKIMGLTQTELSKILNWSQSRVSREFKTIQQKIGHGGKKWTGGE